MPTLDHVSLDRRRLIQATAAALAVIHAPHLLSASAQDAEGGIDAMVGDNNVFAFDLYQQLRATYDTNLLASPYSVSLALAMTWAGAAGSTAEQMAEVLRFPLDPAETAAAFGELSADLTKRGTAEESEDEPGRTLAIANAIWGETSYPFSPDYIALLSEAFHSELNLVDFKGAPEETRIEINDWIATNTNDRIKDIIPEGMITDATRLVLANAIWFYGAWMHQFDPEFTEDGDFILLDGSTVTVPFMRQQEHFTYAAGDGFQAVELPYDGSGLAFTVILPDDGAFEAIEESLDAPTFGDIIGRLERTEVVLRLPSFTFEFGTSLSDALKELGMTEAFSGDADFSGMMDGEPEEQLAISEVIHKAFIKLDEFGTEAAAATVVMMEAMAAPPEDDPIELDVDRPFLFAIRDQETGTLLFLGRVLTPEA